MFNHAALMADAETHLKKSLSELDAIRAEIPRIEKLLSELKTLLGKPLPIHCNHADRMFVPETKCWFCPDCHHVWGAK